MTSLASRLAVRRTAWVVVDQALSSLTNFALTIAVARSVDEFEFGAFATAYVVFTLAAIAARGLITQPLAVRASVDITDLRPASAAAGAVAYFGVVLGVAIVGTGLALGGTVGSTLMVMGLFLGPLLLQDAWRQVFITLARPRAAVANELVWVASQALLLGVVFAVGEPTAVSLTLAWGTAAAVAAIVGVQQAGFTPDMHRGTSFIRQNRDLGVPFAGAGFIQVGSANLGVLLVGAIVGTAGIGAIRGAQALFGPFTVALLGLTLASVPEASRLLARRPGAFPRALVAMSGMLMIVAVALAIALLMLDDAVGEALLGDTWDSSRPLVPAFVASTIVQAAASGALCGLRVLEAAKALLRLRVVVGPVTVAGGLAGAATAGVEGGAWGLVVGPTLTSAVGWWLFHREWASRRGTGETP
jgi:O-antigen/teichoic acid export membrane protein